MTPNWSEDEDNELRQLHRLNWTITDIAAELGRPIRGVASRAHRLGLRYVVNPRDWNAAQDAILEDLSLSDAEMAVLCSQLGKRRTPMAVKRRRIVLGFQRARSPAPWVREGPPEGWPVMSGTAEERDALFVRRVVTAAIEEGLLSRVAA